jgi:arylsulfatase A-like enzyme
MRASSISRRTFLQATSASLGALAWSHGVRGAGADQPRKPPNIIFLLTDDQRWDTLGCMGNRIIRTPSIDGMAAEGVRFGNTFVTTAICCTSRASIFSGQYARRHGIHDFNTAFTTEAWEQTWPARLKQAGFRMGFAGKYGVGPDKDFHKDTFDYWRGIPGQPKYELKDKDGNYQHLTQRLGEQSIEFLRSCSKDQPFCLSVSFKAPHVQDENPRQFLYDPVYRDVYKDVTIPVPKTATEKHLRELPEFLRNDETTARVRWKMRFATPELYQEMVKGYYRLITGVDTVVGRIRQELDRLGHADNTVIIFSGDNGFFLGEHGLAGKWYGYEESIRVPLVIYDPRLAAGLRGRSRREIVLNIDLAPTILALAGVAVPPVMQGVDLTPLLQGQTVPWRTDFLYEHLFDLRPGGRTTSLIPKTEGVVSEQFKYLRYIEQDPPYEQLFDLQADPHEEQNLAGRAGCEDTLNAQRLRLQQLLQACR